MASSNRITAKMTLFQKKEKPTTLIEYQNFFAHSFRKEKHFLLLMRTYVVSPLEFHKYMFSRHNIKI